MKRPLRIGLVLDDSLDRPDGVQQYVLTVGEWLCAQGHEVYYLVGDTTRSDIEGIRTLGRNWHVKFNHNALSIPRPVPKPRIKHVLDELRLDVLHVQAPYHPLLAGRVIREADDRVAIVGTFHILPVSALAAWGTRALASIQRTTHARFDAVMSVSEAAREFAESHYQLSSTVVPNAVDISKFKTVAHRASDMKTIIFLGRLVKRKGAQLLLAAITRLRDEGKINDTRVIIGGKGEMLTELQQYVIDHKLDHIVEFRGFIDEKDKPELLASADIAVFPATGGESFGIVLIEAMAAGAGITLGGDNPGYHSVLGSIPDSLIDPNDVAAFAERLHVLLSDSTRAQKIHDQQMELIKQFDIQTVGPQILARYESALRARC